MGNLCAIPTSHNHTNHKRPTKPSSNRWTRSSRRDTINIDDASIQEQAIMAAMLLRHHHHNTNNNNNATFQFDRSSSLRQPNVNVNNNNNKKKNSLPRSSSSRPRSLTDPLLLPHQLLNQDIKLNDLVTNHFVLVHGGGFGAWCWYKTIALLEEAGFKVDAIDLAGSGVDPFDTNNVTCISQYVKPLTDFLDKLPEGEKVILVGHDIGGACISYAIELFPLKISKAVFISAAMLISGQSTLDIFSQQEGSNDLLQRAQIFLYSNGKDQPPSSIDLDKSLLRDLLFNRSPGKDVALASVSMRPIPFAPILEKLSLSDLRYGSVRRFYIVTPEDNAIPVTVQENMINSNPPEKVLRLKGADHSPFFSKPQALHKLLVEISQIP